MLSSRYRFSSGLHLTSRLLYSFFKWPALSRAVRCKEEEDVQASKDRAAINNAVLVGFRSAYVFERLTQFSWIDASLTCKFGISGGQS
jgi:hypothetical protein